MTTAHEAQIGIRERSWFNSAPLAQELNAVEHAIMSGVHGTALADRIPAGSNAYCHLWFTALEAGNTTAAQMLLERLPTLPHAVYEQSLQLLVDLKDEDTLLWLLDKNLHAPTVLAQHFVKICAWITPNAIEQLAQHIEITPRMYGMGLFEACGNPSAPSVLHLTHTAGPEQLRTLAKGAASIELAQALGDPQMLQKATAFAHIAHQPPPGTQLKFHM